MTEAKSKPEVLVLWGLPASGKTTKALEWVEADPNHRTRINYDDLRKAAGIVPGTFNRKSEDAIQQQAIEQFESAMQLGLSVVIDNTSLKESVRQAWINRAIKYDVQVKVERVGAEESIWDIIRRDASRGSARVGRAVIERMALFNGLIDWTEYDQENGFVICDLDGTLADITHRRHFLERHCKKCGTLASPTAKVCSNDPPDMTGNCGGELTSKDWASFFANVAGDGLNGPLAGLIDILYDEGYYVLLVTGRPINPCGIPTEDWLKRHEIRYDHLFMRNGGDNRPDTVVKQEILDLLPKDRIDYVFEDRSSVVDMWRENGLFTLQVAKGEF